MSEAAKVADAGDKQEPAATDTAPTTDFIPTLQDGAAAAAAAKTSAKAAVAGSKAPGSRARASAATGSARAPRGNGVGRTARGGGGGGGAARSRSSGQQQVRRRAAGAAASAAASAAPPLPPGAVAVFTEDFLRLNAQREKAARQLRRAVILREEETLLRVRHTEDLADAATDLQARCEACTADANLLAGALTDLLGRVQRELPEVAAATEPPPKGEDDADCLAAQKMAHAVRSLKGRVNAEAALRVLTEFAANPSFSC